MMLSIVFMIDDVTLSDYMNKYITLPLATSTNKQTLLCSVVSVLFLSCSQHSVVFSRVAVVILDCSRLVPPAAIWRLITTHTVNLGIFGVKIFLFIHTVLKIKKRKLING